MQPNGRARGHQARQGALGDARLRRRYDTRQVPLKPYRDTTSSFLELRQLIDAERWKDATRATRTVLLASQFSTSTIRELDAAWTAASMGRFGFSAQLRAVAVPLPPAGAWEDDWAYATRVGEAVGWRQASGWLRWRDAAWPSGVGALLEIAGPASSFPEGCFPFHDAVTSDAWPAGFSPRDCWGTAVWTTWCRVWRSLDTGP